MIITTLVFLVACFDHSVPVDNAVEVTENETPWVFSSVVVPDPVTSAMQPSTVTTATRGGVSYDIGYDVLLRVGQVVDGWEFGRIADSAGEPILGDVGYCNRVDYSGLFQAHGGLWVITHLECIPGGLHLTKIQQDTMTGDLSVEWSRPIANAAVNGTWLPCAGHTTDWGTVLSSEEYEADAADATVEGSRTQKNMIRMAAWNKTDGALTPYHYGWIPEITVTDALGEIAIEKHYAMGRFSHEVARVLSDERTVMMSDDQRGAGFFMFVADTPRDFSAGILYAAKVGPTADISWISLGHSDGADVSTALDAGIVFEQLFDSVSPTDGLTCPDGYRLVSAASTDECLKLASPTNDIPDPASLASRLESRRYAGYLGATTEFVKAEGIAYDAAKGQLYMALSLVVQQSTKNTSDSLKPDHLQFPNNRCGAILEGPLVANIRDSAGTVIPSDLVLASLAVLTVGVPTLEDGIEMCASTGISNPDNIAFMAGQNALLISEDSGFHALNRLWYFDLKTAELTALQLSPLAGEMSAAQWFTGFGGFDYLGSAVQHPFRFGKDDPNRVEATVEQKASYLGFIGPFPSSHQ